MRKATGRGLSSPAPLMYRSSGASASTEPHPIRVLSRPSQKLALPPPSPTLVALSVIRTTMAVYSVSPAHIRI
eukprot:2967769-Pleurochrysis_carterae.AAC.2